MLSYYYYIYGTPELWLLGKCDFDWLIDWLTDWLILLASKQANKQTNAGENITSLAEVIKTKISHG